MRTPVFGVAVITPLILAGAAGASAPSPNAPASGASVTPLAAVEPSQRDGSGASVVAVTKTPTALHIATANVSAPPSGEFAWHPSYSGDGADRLPQR